MRPGGDLNFSPGKEDVWVVALLLSKLTHAIHKPEGSAKVRKLEGPRDVVFFDDVPLVDLLLKYGELLALEWRHASTARNTSLRREVRHLRSYSTTRLPDDQSTPSRPSDLLK